MGVHGKNGYIEVNTANLSTYLNSAGLDKALDAVDVTTFTKNDKVYIQGLKDATFTLEGKWDATVDGLMATAETEQDTNGVVAFEYAPAGKANSRVKYSGNAIRTSYNISQDVNGEITFSANYQVTAGVTRGTYSGL
jgi:hypothetical protein